MAERPQRDGPEPVLVPADQLGEGITVAVEVPPEQVAVVRVPLVVGHRGKVAPPLRPQRKFGSVSISRCDG